MENTNVENITERSSADIVEELTGALNSMYAMGRRDAYTALLKTIQQITEESRPEENLGPDYVPVLQIDQLVVFLQNQIDIEETNIGKTDNVLITVTE